MKEMAIKSKAASKEMARASSVQKNQALEAIIKNLELHKEEILQANQEDIANAKKNGLNEAMIDRLSLQNRWEGMIGDMQAVLQMQDPIGEIFDEATLASGLLVVKCRTAIGVLGVIYESRPNVTLDVSALSIKSGNAAILRGGSETLCTNRVLVKVIQKALLSSGLAKDAIQLVESSDRSKVLEMLQLYEHIDLIIPRGSSALQKFCKENSKIPVITGGIGICHLFVDASADLERSLHVIANAKTQRPTVCNALDTLLVHEKIASFFIPEAVKFLREKKVVFKLDETSWNTLDEHLFCEKAGPQDFDTEWMSLCLGIKVVKNIDEAIEHIRVHSLGHSDGILTEDKKNAEHFVREVDSAAVYVNASTRFSDGSQLGLGAEVAITTQKIHARGPMGLKELTSYKWIVKGDYQCRK